METNISWFSFFQITVLLITIYIFLRLLMGLLPQFLKRKSVLNRTILVLNKSIEIYKPFAILLLLLSFVSVNYKVHGILFLLFLIVTFTHIKRYIYGVLFKINPLVNLGANLSTGEFKGDISKFLFFGIVINEADGNRFINYSYIDKHGFSINQNDNASLRKTIYIHNQEMTSTILDLLFDNPIVDFTNKPFIKKIPNENIFQLQVALENGAKMESLITYLNQNNIKTTSTKN